RQRGLAPHQYRLAQCERLEALQVVRQMPRHGAIAPYGVVAIECGDQGERHAHIVAVRSAQVSRLRRFHFCNYICNLCRTRSAENLMISTGLTLLRLALSAANPRIEALYRKPNTSRRH